MSNNARSDALMPTINSDSDMTPQKQKSPDWIKAELGDDGLIVGSLSHSKNA